MLHRLGEAASLIGQHVKVEPNTMLRKNHLYELFKNTAYLSSRVVGGASSVDPEADFKRYCLLYMSMHIVPGVKSDVCRF